MKTGFGGKTSAGRQSSLLKFSVGGRPLAAKIEDVREVWPWSAAASVPSGTPFVNAVLRHGEDMLPVYDLAGMLGVQVQGAHPLCLVAKHELGPVAICIDGEVPSLQTVETASIQPMEATESSFSTACSLGGKEVPLLSFPDPDEPNR